MHVAKRLILDRVVSADWFKNPHIPPWVSSKLKDVEQLCKDAGSKGSKAVVLTDKDEEEIRTALVDLGKTHEEIMGISNRTFTAFDWKPRTKGDTDKFVKSEDVRGKNSESDNGDDREDDMFGFGDGDEDSTYEGVEFGFVGKKLTTKRQKKKKKKKVKRGKNVQWHDLRGCMESDDELSSSKSNGAVDSKEEDDNALPKWIRKEIRKMRIKSGDKFISPADIIIRGWEEEEEDEDEADGDQVEGNKCRQDIEKETVAREECIMKNPMEVDGNSKRNATCGNDDVLEGGRVGDGMDAAKTS
jgi:hypothetical protein